jgi:hypothetical protein
MTTCLTCGRPTCAGTTATGPRCSQHYVQAVRAAASQAIATTGN